MSFQKDYKTMPSKKRPTLCGDSGSQNLNVTDWWIERENER